MSAVDPARARAAASRHAGMIPTAALGLAVVVLLAVVALGSHGSLHAPGPRLHYTPAGVRQAVPTGHRVQGGGDGWLRYLGLALLAAVAAVLAVVAVVVLAQIRGRPRWARGTVHRAVAAPAELDEARRAALREALVRSLEEIRNDPNARRAIIGAYRLMEVTLGRVGLTREPAEAPREYLTRALCALDLGPEAPRTLTALFERARFGEAELDLGLRDEAVSCLVSLRASL